VSENQEKVRVRLSVEDARRLLDGIDALPALGSIPLSALWELRRATKRAERRKSALSALAPTVEGAGVERLPGPWKDRVRCPTCRVWWGYAADGRCPRCGRVLVATPPPQPEPAAPLDGVTPRWFTPRPPAAPSVTPPPRDADDEFARWVATATPPDGETRGDGCWHGEKGHPCALGELAKMRAERDAEKARADAAEKALAKTKDNMEEMERDLYLKLDAAEKRAEEAVAKAREWEALAKRFSANYDAARARAEAIQRDHGADLSRLDKWRLRAGVAERRIAEAAGFLRLIIQPSDNVQAAINALTPPSVSGGAE
jgi:hypothetical protein